MVLEGEQWLARLATYRQPDATYWREAAVPLADLLTYAWELPDNQLRQDTPASEVFKKLPGYWLRGGVAWDYP